MADVSKIKLPDNTEVNIKDSRIPSIDTTPTSGSTNVVTSGGVYDSIQSVVTISTDQSISGQKTFTSGQIIVSTNSSGKPTITLVRGAATDTYVDWKIVNDGALVIKRSVSSTDTDSVRFGPGAIALITDGSGTPTIEFRRGTASDTNVDNKIISNNGALHFVKSVSGTDTDLASIDSNGNFSAVGTVTGTNIPTYYTGTSDPASSLGSDGDIYLKLSS